MLGDLGLERPYSLGNLRGGVLGIWGGVRGF